MPPEKPWRPSLRCTRRTCGKPAKPNRLRKRFCWSKTKSNLRHLARQYLENQGYTVIEAADGAAAMQISQAHQGPIHLLLTDVIMPGMNGRELAHRFSAMRPEMKVLYMSGYTRERTSATTARWMKASRLLQKPFTLPALKAKVREKLSRLTRAQRFKLHVPLKYRLVGEGNWRKGTTENISRSGMLFRAEEMVSPNTMLEISIVLPAEIAGLSAAEVVCRGEVVRTLEPKQPMMNPALAAKILQYHFQHGLQPPPG